jgi:hypothetical protein
MVQMEFNFVDEEPDTKAASESTHLQMLRFDNIAAMIADRNQPVWITSRKICGEMVATIKLLQMPVGYCQRRVLAQTQLKSRMKALRELQRTLLDGEALSKQDGLNLDSGKFKFVLETMIRLFGQALAGAGADDFMAQNIVLQFRDLVMANNEALRRDLNLIDTKAHWY